MADCDISKVREAWPLRSARFGAPGSRCAAQSGSTSSVAGSSGPPAAFQTGVKPLKAYKNMDFINSSEAKPIRIMCEYFETASRLEREQVESASVKHDRGLVDCATRLVRRHDRGFWERARALDG